MNRGYHLHDLQHAVNRALGPASVTSPGPVVLCKTLVEEREVKPIGLFSTASGEKVIPKGSLYAETRDGRKVPLHKVGRAPDLIARAILRALY